MWSANFHSSSSHLSFSGSQGGLQPVLSIAGLTGGLGVHWMRWEGTYTPTLSHNMGNFKMPINIIITLRIIFNW